MNDIFIQNNLPKSLTKEENNILFEKYSQGDSKARETLITHNIRLVLSIINKNFRNNDSKELLAIGNIGLIKAVDSFDHTKGIYFSTYATRCIYNEIALFFRKENKYFNNISIEETISSDKNGNDLKLIDSLSDNFDIEINCMKKEELINLRESLICLNDKEKMYLFHYYGLAGFEELNQRQIAEKYNTNASTVSKTISKAYKKLRKNLK